MEWFTDKHSRHFIMKQFNTTKEELLKLGLEFKSQAFNLIDDC